MEKRPSRAGFPSTTLVGASLFGALALTMAVSIAPAAGQDADDDQESKFNYTVEDGRYADESTVMGFEVYTGTCAACHGPDGLGSSFAPSLIRMAERRTFADFAQTVAEGQSIQPGMVMPSFADDMRVMTHLEDIWNYLGARLEGGLERGRPRPLEAAESTDAPDASDDAEETEGSEETEE